MFDWNDEELGDIIWGEASEVGDHIVPYPKGNEAKPLFTTGDHRKKQSLENSRPAKFADQKVSGANSFFSGSKVENDSECNTKETLPAPGTEVDSWPDSPLINVACDGKYAGRNSGSSVYMQASDFGAEMPKYVSARADTAQLDDRSGLFGNECEDKEDDGFLEYSWDNVGAFDDLDSMFRNDDPIFGRESLGSGELWSSSADIFTSPAKSFPTCSPNSSVNALSMSDHEMKMEFVQQENSSHTPGFGRTDHLCSYDTKDIDLRKENSSGKEGCHHVDPLVDCVGGMSDTSLGKTNPKMIDTMEAWKTNSSSKVNGKRKLVKCPTKEETDERSSQDLHCSWSLTANQLQSFGDQFALSSVQSIPSSVSSQKQLVAPVSLAYWQTSNPYLSSLDDNPQRHCTVMPTFQNARTERDMHQLALVDYGNSSGSLKHSNPMNVFPAPSRPPIMTPQEKLEKLKRRQQMQAMLAIQEQQQQFGHKAPHADLFNTEKCPRENQHQDAEGSSIDVEENLNIPPLMEPKTPAEHNYSNTVAMVLDDCSLEEKVLDQLQGVIGKLDIKVRLCIRDSLFRLAQSASQRHNTLDTSSTNNNMQCDGVAQKDEAYVHNRLPRIPEVETETNPIDRTIAHLLFHQPLEPFSRPVKDCEAPESPAFTKLICEPKTECMKNLSAGCLSECSIDEGSLSQPSCMETDTKDVDQFQSNTYINPPEKTSNGELGDLGE